MSRCLQSVHAFSLYPESERGAGGGQDLNNCACKGWATSKVLRIEATDAGRGKMMQIQYLSTSPVAWRSTRYCS